MAGWLSPLGDGSACGPDLEYDATFFELARAAGTPDSQFGPGEPPDWARVRELAEALFARTRDLRVALWWGRAVLRLDGFSRLPSVLALLHGLLDRFWEELHPLPDADDADAVARLSVLGALDKLDSLLGDIRDATLSPDPRLAGLRVRDVEVALSRLAPSPDAAALTQGQLAGMMAQGSEAAEALRRQAESGLHLLGAIQALMSRRFRADLHVDLKCLRGMLEGIELLLPAGVPPTAGAQDVIAEPRPPMPLAGSVHGIESRQDAIRAIELVCAYLERCEPTNPAQLLLRRAARVIDKSFLQLMRELAPDAVKDVARILGVDPNATAEPA